MTTIDSHCQAGAKFIRVTPDDDVAVALCDLDRGEILETDELTVILGAPIPAGHKFALTAVVKGDVVRRYGAPIGVAKCAIEPGDHVHSHNLGTALRGETVYRYTPETRGANGVRSSLKQFMGYPRPDGSVGTRNEIWILPTVGCVGRLAERLRTAAMVEIANGIDGIYAFTHPFGCSQLGVDLNDTSALLAALAQNPNTGGVLLVGLGCESNQIDSVLERIPPERRDRIRLLRAQTASDEFAEGMAALNELIELACDDERVLCPLSSLRIGVKCGGSDGMSGLTANPLIGRVADAVTAADGYAILTEIPEIFGAEQLLMARADRRETFDQLVTLVNRFKRYFLDHGQLVSENPSPGNIAGGITTLEEKSLGAVQKGGTALITDVIDYACRQQRSGLALLESPGNDAISTTALVAAGATLIMFSTGRGTPLGSPVPTLKIASNRPLAERKPHWIDFDASIALDMGLDVASERLFDLVIATASGAAARNEVNNERSIGIWKRGVTL